MNEKSSNIPPNRIKEEDWEEALKKRKLIEQWLEQPIKTAEIAKEYAQALNCSLATFYRWVKKFSENRSTTSLVPSLHKGNKKKRRLSVRQEQIIAEVITSDYLQKERTHPALIIEEVQRRCHLEEIKSPAPNTIRSRIKDVPVYKAVSRRESKSKADQKHTLIKGSLPGADFPLSLVQIDHTKTDVFLVDPEHREVIDRAWITSAIDCYSRACVGVHITFGAPSTLSTALCLTRSVLPKDAWLQQLEVSGSWPMQGIPACLHVDNGTDFHSKAFKRGCEEYGIVLNHRPIKRPQFGGTIEKHLGTLMKRVQTLPGTTFSNPLMRGEYDSQKHACLTLHELERYLINFIVNVYNQRVHQSISMPPYAKFEQGLGLHSSSQIKTFVRMPPDNEAFLIHFLPMMERSVQRYGIVLDNICYASDVLADLVHKGDKRKFEIRRDPRDISKIYFFHPEDRQFYEVPYRNKALPPMSLWEYKHLRERLQKEGKSHVDEDLIFQALGEMRSQVKTAQKESKKARKVKSLSSKEAYATQPDSALNQSEKETIEEDFDFDMITEEIKLR